MGDRVQVGDLTRAPRKQVRAKVVDTYVNPDVVKPAESNMSELANALSKFEPSLEGYLTKKHKTYTDREVNEGMEAARQNALGFKEAIKQELIPAGSSPWFQKGYKHEQGVYLNREYNKTLTRAWQEWEGKDSEDPAAFTAWLAEQRTNFSGNINGDPDVQRGYNSGAALTENNLSAHHTKYVAQRFEEKRNNVMYANTTSDIEALTSKTLSKEDLINRVVQRGKDFHFEGGDGAKYAELTTTAIIQLAKDTDNDELLDLLDEINLSGRGALSSKPDVAKLKGQAEDQIFSSIISKGNYVRQSQERQKKANGEAALIAVWEVIGNDPNAHISDADMKAGLKLDPKFATKVAAFRTLAADDNTREKEPDILELQHCVYSRSCGVGDIYEAIEDGRVRDKATASALFSANQRLTGYKGYGFTSSTDRILTQIEKGLFSTIKGNDLDFSRERAGNAANARVIFMEELMDYKEKNPKANSLDVRKFAKELRDDLLLQFNKDDAQEVKDGIIEPAKSAQEHVQAKNAGDEEWTYKPLFSNKAELSAEINAARLGGTNNLTRMFDKLNLTPAEQQKVIETQMKLLGD